MYYIPRFWKNYGDEMGNIRIERNVSMERKLLLLFDGRQSFQGSLAEPTRKKSN